MTMTDLTLVAEGDHRVAEGPLWQTDEEVFVWAALDRPFPPVQREVIAANVPGICLDTNDHEISTGSRNERVCLRNFQTGDVCIACNNNPFLIAFEEVVSYYHSSTCGIRRIYCITFVADTCVRNSFSAIQYRRRQRQD